MRPADFPPHLEKKKKKPTTCCFRGQKRKKKEISSLPRNISPREVVPRVGLRVPQCLCLLDHFGEAASGAQRVEDIRQRAAEDPFDFEDAVPGVSEVLERRDDREARADGGLFCFSFLKVFFFIAVPGKVSLRVILYQQSVEKGGEMDPNEIIQR